MRLDDPWHANETYIVEAESILYSVGCLEFMGKNRQMCEDEGHAMDFKLDPTSFYVFIVVLAPWLGIVNNIISLTVLFQNKYNTRLFPSLLRCSYLFRLVMSLLMAKYYAVLLMRSSEFGDRENIYHLVVFLAGTTFLRMAKGTIAVMSAIRYIYSRNPFYFNFNENASKCVYTFLMVMFAFSVGINALYFIMTSYTASRFSRIFNALFWLVCVCVALVFNLLTFTRDRQMKRRFSVRVNGYKSTNILASGTLSKYSRLSSIVFIVTTLPGVIYLFYLEMDLYPVSCSACASQGQVGFTLINLITWNCFFDNLFYVAFSADYRNNLREMWRHYGRVFNCCSDPTLGSLSLTSFSLPR